MKKLLLILFSILSFSCTPVNNTINDKKIKEIDSLKNVISSLNLEIENYKNTPDKLLFQAQIAFKNRDKLSLISIEKDINKYHPGSKEAVSISSLKQEIIKYETDSIEKEKKERLQAVNKLKKEYDDISETTWYHQPYFKHNNNSNLVSMYIGVSGSMVWLRMKVSYSGDDWIFFDDITLAIEGNAHTIPFDEYRDKKSDNDGGYVWEWVDVSIDDNRLDYIRNEFLNGKNRRVRLRGKYGTTRTLSNKEIEGLKLVLKAYDVLKAEIER